MSKDTSSKAAKSASHVLRDGRAAKASKTAAGSALSQHAMSKRANLSSAQADRAVDRYLSKKG